MRRFQSFEVRRLSIRRRLAASFEKGVDVLAQDHADRMNRVVSIEPPVPESLKCLDDDVFTEGELVLHDNVDDRVKLTARQ